MKSILATITVSPQPFPAGTVAQSYRFEITGPENRFIDVPYAGPLSAQFDEVPDGTYTVTAELLDGAGQRLGGLLSQQAIVSTAPADIILQVPAGLTVQVLTTP